jgi:hypothetical protein
MISDPALIKIPGVPQKIQHPGNLGSQKKEPKLPLWVCAPAIPQELLNVPRS